MGPVGAGGPGRRWPLAAWTPALCRPAVAPGGHEPGQVSAASGPRRKQERLPGWSAPCSDPRASARGRHRTAGCWAARDTPTLPKPQSPHPQHETGGLGTGVAQPRSLPWVPPPCGTTAADGAGAPDAREPDHARLSLAWSRSPNPQSHGSAPCRARPGRCRPRST